MARPPKDPRVDAYIASRAEFAQPILNYLRKLVHRAVPEAEETIKWGMPAFVYRGKILCGFAGFKAHATFGFWHRGMEKLLTRELGRTHDALGSLGRITRRSDLPDDDALVEYLLAAKRLHDSGAPARIKARKRPELTLPADLAEALKRNRRAAAVWTAFAPSHRRDYLEWILEAKRPETREKRLLTTLEWVAEGKKRNWKYETC